MCTRTIVTTVVGIVLVTPAVWAGPTTTPRGRPAGINARQHRQAQRIKSGVKDGEITKAEANRLRADEAGIRADGRVYRASGDGLDKREAKDLEKDLNKTNREIFRARHNKRQPGGNQQHRVTV